jgi:hypothetical protein
MGHTEEDKSKETFEATFNTSLTKDVVATNAINSTQRNVAVKKTKADDVAYVAPYALAIVTITITLPIAETYGTKGVDIGGLGVEMTTIDVVAPLKELVANF